ncbi:hypothetical protein L1887_40587 [Cichorium endivia]|nr:hypothetical protein L1887_40587 [Cichorium endivia]
MGLCQPYRRAGQNGRSGSLRSGHESVVSPRSGSSAVPARDGQLLGLHPHRRRLAHVGGAALSRVGLQPAANRGSVSVLRTLWCDHQPGGWLSRGPTGFEPDHEHRAGHAGGGAVDADSALGLADHPLGDGAQALSGIAKDLNKMSAKSSIKLLVPDGQQGKLYKWVAILTGSKNALKGVGFFLGGALLALIGFKGALLGNGGCPGAYSGSAA